MVLAPGLRRPRGWPNGRKRPPRGSNPDGPLRNPLAASVRQSRMKVLSAVRTPGMIWLGRPGPFQCAQEWQPHGVAIRISKYSGRLGLAYAAPRLREGSDMTTIWVPQT